MYAYDPYDGVVEVEHHELQLQPVPPPPAASASAQSQQQQQQHAHDESIKPSIVSAPLRHHVDEDDDDDDDIHHHHHHHDVATASAPAPPPPPTSSSSRVHGDRDRERDSVHEHSRRAGDDDDERLYCSTALPLVVGLDNASIAEVNARYQPHHPHRHRQHHHHVNTISMHELRDELQRSGYHHSQLDQLEIARDQPIFKIFQNFCPKNETSAHHDIEEEEEDNAACEDDDLKQAAQAPVTEDEHERGSAADAAACGWDKCSVRSAATTVSTKSSCKSSYGHGDSHKMSVVGISRRTVSTLSEPQPEYYAGDMFRATYRVGQRINEGGFGCVWKIDDHSLYARCVKIMEMGVDEHAQRRRCKAVVREFAMTQKAMSDEVVDVELFLDDVRRVSHPRAYLVMPYFEGRDLFDYIDDEAYARTASTALILDIFHNILEKLHELHYSKLMVHGDLKPENVIVLQSKAGGAELQVAVEIIDYGIAKSIRNLSCDTRYLKSSGHFGTKGYVAPELMNHSRYNRKIDVFSAGVVLYNMVTECCLFPKGHKYYEMSASEYYRYLRKKFKCIAKKRKVLVDILYSCLTFDADERLDVKSLIQRYFHSRIH